MDYFCRALTKQALYSHKVSEIHGNPAPSRFDQINPSFPHVGYISPHPKKLKKKIWIPLDTQKSLLPNNNICIVIILFYSAWHYKEKITAV